MHPGRDISHVGGSHIWDVNQCFRDDWTTSGVMEKEMMLEVAWNHLIPNSHILWTQAIPKQLDDLLGLVRFFVLIYFCLL